MGAREKPAGVVSRHERRKDDDKWQTALTCIEPNKILVRGYPLDEMMGRLTFGEAIYLLLMGEIPPPGIGSLMEALLISFIDHGATPPSTLAARNTATTGAPLRACIASGILGFGRHRGGTSYREAAGEIVERWTQRDEAIPGFGHRFHTRDPRAARLFQMALELEAEGEHIQLIRQVEIVVAQSQHPLPVNIDGAIAALCGDIFIPPNAANLLFIISRVPGISSQSLLAVDLH